MEYINNLSYLIIVLVSFVIILLTNKFTKNLSLSLIFGIIILSLLAGHSFINANKIIYNRFFSLDNILLIIVIFQVICLSSQMSLTGLVNNIVDAVKAKISHRTSLAVLPAIIGLLPMPGGAIFSAPLVNDCDNNNSIDPVLKVKINYWFRHVWEYWWPMYPGVLLAIDLTGIPITHFMFYQLPLSFVSIIGGYLFLLKKIKLQENKHENLKKTYTDIFKTLFPINLIILNYLILKLIASYYAYNNKYLFIIISILVTQIFIQYKKPIAFQAWKKILLSVKTFQLILLVELVRIYGAFIEAQLPDGSFIMDHMKAELNLIGIPLIIIIIIIPFISGFTTGIAIGFVGASFPIVLSLIDKTSYGDVISTTFLAYAAGYMGMMLSPVHICLIVTNEYFKTNLSVSLMRLIKPALFVLSVSLIFYFILRVILL